MPDYNKFFRNKTILVTGATGTVGQELTRALLKYNPKTLRVYSRDESRQFDMAHKFSQYKNIRFLLGDVRDRERLDRAFENVDYVYHLAALKHVGACEYNPFEAVKTNIQGTQNVLDSAILNEVDQVLFTSSDKAANPSNAMGASKLMAERLVIAANAYKGKRRTRFSIVRLGNVLGSRGSIIPLMINQLRTGKSVTLTDPDMTRYVITMKNIIRFIVECSYFLQGGEIFVPQMKTVTTPDLIRAIVNQYCAKHGRDSNKVKIRTIGARPGEKNYEELITEEESSRSWICKTHYFVHPQISDVITPLKISKRKYQKAILGAVSSFQSKHLTLGQIEKLIAPYIE
ncbi:SDR family NAD(P)-dependent oxidoreductase [Planctomycetota bacterium]